VSAHTALIGGALLWLAGIVIGWLAHGTWVEGRHDCMPHDPEVCEMEPR
jgi:hypothetical protein